MHTLTVIGWMNDNGAALSSLAAIVTAVIAIVALQRTVTDSRERSRPVVLAEFRSAKNDHNTIDLVVRNAGQSVARDVRVSFDPQPGHGNGVDDRMSKWLIQRYRDTIPSLAPGQELLNIWHAARAVKGQPDLVNVEPTADEVTVTISYRRSRFRRYVDVYPLTVDLVRMTTFATSSESIPGRIKAIQSALVGLQASAATIAQATNYVRREQIQQEKDDLPADIERIQRMEAERQAQLQLQLEAKPTDGGPGQRARP